MFNIDKGDDIYYFKFQIPVSKIFDILNTEHYTQIVFFIDLPSITKGFYNKDTVQLEITNYVKTKKLPTVLLEEAKQYLSNLFNIFSKYNPKFVIFYDDGLCLQNTTIDKSYKSNRISGLDNLLIDDDKIQLFRQIRKYYYEEFEKIFNIKNHCRIIYFREYESDLIPFFYLNENILKCAEKDTLNLILSADKDLLQCLQWTNTKQVITNYSKKNRKLNFNIFDDENAIEYIYKNFKRGFLTSKYIPLILSLGGDSSDNIPKVRNNIGPATACEMIIAYKIPDRISDATVFPQSINEYKKQIIKNYKLVSFEEQIKRIPFNILEKIRRPE